MSLELTLLSGQLYIELPEGWAGWLGWLLWLFLILFLLRKEWGFQRKRKALRFWGIFIVLAALVPLAALFIVVRLPAGEVLPLPSRPVEPSSPALVIFSALPWILAAGFLGPGPSVLFAAASGALLALGDTHNPFTPLEFATLALLFCALIYQRYRTPFYRILAHPLAAVFPLALAYPFLYLAGSILFVEGTLASRLDFALSYLATGSIIGAVELLVAALFAEVLSAAFASHWGSHTPLVPSPSERKIETRFYFQIAPLALVLLILIMVGDWNEAYRSARQMLEERMETTAESASESIPFFIEAGQNQVQQIAQDGRLATEPASRLSTILAEDLRTVPFFRQLFLVDDQGKALAGYPEVNFANAPASPEELVGIRLALNGVPVQYYTLPPLAGDTAAQVSFIASLPASSGSVQRVLVGRTDLATNILTRPVIASLNAITKPNGESIILDANGRILYHPSPARLMESYTGQTSDLPTFFDAAAPDGTRQMVFYQPVSGQPWAIVLAIPARRAQGMALNLAIPLLGLILMLFVAAVFLLRWGLRGVTHSLQGLGQEVDRISSGQLDHPLPVDGYDEIGQLRRAFEQMRLHLKARIDELNQLLVVSQGVASSLEMKEAVKPILESALSLGASSARVVLAPSAVPEIDGDLSTPTRFGLGASSEAFNSIDEQVMELTRKQDPLSFNNLARVRVINFTPGQPRPEALLALALRHEHQFYGTLWLAFDRPHAYSDDEMRFVSTLAGQAALAAANSHLYQSAEIGRQRLAAILASTPDPVLVTDHQNRLLLSNPAAWQVLGLGAETGERQPIERLFPQKDLVKLLRSGEEKQSLEVTLAGGKIYLATVSSVIIEAQRVGRVCLLRDITQFKELDKLKSEFVATVSHDLRSPLTLMRGYATMLEMHGELNDQQANFAKRINAAVDSMTHLVNNLLDLSRIEAGIDLQLETVLVHDIVEKVVNNFQPDAIQKRISLAFEIPSQTIPLIEADPALLQQALQNLVENGIKYTEAGGKVDVRVQTRTEGMVFEVKDNGIGIAPVDQVRLFEKFYRGGQREARKQHGTGLGLAIVKSIAERHHGRVWLESQLGKGSTFYMLIPLRQPRTEPKAPPSFVNTAL